VINEMGQEADKNFVGSVDPLQGVGEDRLGAFDEERQEHYQARGWRNRAGCPKMGVRGIRQENG
jgi:hypothetical protein